MFRLFTDTDTDVTPEIAKEYGYSLISMPYSIDGVLTYPYEDFDEFKSKEFYDSLRSGVLPVTSAISKERYINYFSPVLEKGEDILYVHFSRAMTMTFNAMDEAIAELKVKYPERTVYTIDTKAITILSLNVAREVGEMYLQGKTVEEIHEWADREVLHFALYFFADDLKFFQKSGRVSGIAGTMGTLLGIRPIIYINDEGRMVSIGKEKGRRKAIDRLVSEVDELGDDIKNHRIIIGHTDALDICLEIKEALIAKYGELDNIEIVCVNPTAGSHCGPNGVGICFHAKHR
ncbi:MAG: DegV family protein [Clostridia bacterium]|nr:DegV family protein [Clostridia bacterium]